MKTDRAAKVRERQAVTAPPQEREEPEEEGRDAEDAPDHRERVLHEPRNRHHDEPRGEDLRQHAAGIGGRWEQQRQLAGDESHDEGHRAEEPE